MDYEDLFAKILSYYKTELNAQIDAINTAKTDAVLIKPAAWYEESLDDEAKSFDYFAFIGTANSTGKTTGRAIAIEYEIEIDLFIPNAQDGKIQKKLKRYNQAMLKAAQNTWRKVGLGYGDLEINILSPINASLNNSSRAYKLLGINLKFTMVFN